MMSEYICKYRAYFWGNFYLSSIQQGIQAGHVIGNMAISCQENSDFIQWADEDKTMILRNGGDHISLYNFVTDLQIQGGEYSWDYFEESGDALSNSITSVGIILPNYVYNPAYEPAYYDDSFEATIYRKIKKTPLAI
jgi:hypothetical protein